MREFWKFGLLSLLFLLPTPARADHYAEEIKMLRSRAVELQFQGSPNEALDYYQKALNTASAAYGANSPFLAEIYFDMGSLCLSSSNFNKAEEYLKETVKLSPNSSAAHLRLAELMRLKGRGDEAAKQAGLVVAKHRDDLVARHELALAYERSDDSWRAMREYSAMDQILQSERDRASGKAPTLSFVLPAFVKPAVKPVLKPKVDDSAAPAKKAQDKDKAALAAAKKAELEARKKAEQEAKKALEALKKAEQEAKKPALEAKKKAEQEKKAADAKRKADAAKKAAQAKKKAPASKPEDASLAGSEAAPLSGLPANLRAKAVLLTPVKAKSSETSPAKKAPAKPVAAEDGNGDTEEAATKPPLKKELKPKAPETKAPPPPKPGKHAPGLVPPPPPVMTFPNMPVMQPPPPVQAPKPKPPAPAPKKEEKAKETVKEEKSGGAEDDDFLLDWGGAKGKKK
ncbi:MAG: tetratricopeptide repeat protein [Candidatus Obscuribacterales bacterium]|nr:tetratricopeptide repeat protein [Candidatus Obscuribacterales bacterium]